MPLFQDAAKDANKKGDYKIPDTGNFPARCIQVIDIGTQSWESAMYGSQVKHKVRISWELPTETVMYDEEKGEQPFIISKEYNLSFNEKAGLRIMLESWRGKKFTDEEMKAFSEQQILGKACMLNVTHNTSGENIYANIASVTPMPKGMECPPQVHPSIFLSLDPDEFNQEVYDALPEFIQKKIADSPEGQKVLGLAPDSTPLPVQPKNAPIPATASVPEPVPLPEIKYESDIKPEDLPF